MVDIKEKEMITVKANKKVYILTSLIVIMAILTSACGLLGGEKKVGKDVIAVIDGKEVSVSEFEVVLNTYKMIYEFEYGKEIWNREIEGKEAIEHVKEGALEMTVLLNVVMPRAKKDNIAINPEELEDELEGWINLLGDEDSYKEVLKNNNLTEEDFKGFVEKTLIFRTYIQSFAQTVNMTPQEANEYYNAHPERFNVEQVKASHILVETREEALEIIEKLKQGADFGDLAVEYSVEPAAQYTKGGLGYFDRYRMVSEFSDAAFALEIGQISEPVETEFGFHVIKVEDKRDSVPFEDIKDQLMEDTYAFESVLFNRLKKGHKIFTYPENVTNSQN